MLLELKYLYDSIQILCIATLLSVVCWYLYYLYCFTYWKRKGLSSRSPSFPGGDITSAIFCQENLFEKIQNIYRESKVQGHKHTGLYFFNGPIYFPIDPELIKRICVTDFDYFVDRGVYCNEEKFPLTGHVFILSTGKWKKLRAKLSPAFTFSKLKLFYKDIFIKNTKNLVDVMGNAANGRDINVKPIFNYFTADIIADSTFGLETDMLHNPNSKFANIVSKIFDPPLWLYIKTLFQEGLQNPGNVFKPMHTNKEVEDFFIKLTKETIQYRDENKVERNDFMSWLLTVRDKLGLTMNEIIAQSFLFFLASFDTSSSTISFCLHELAYYPECQKRLREEIYTNLGKDFEKYDCEVLLKLPYLDMVFKETLRLYPVLGFLNRIVRKQYQVPGTNVILEKGTPVIISSLGLQRDPDYFPDPLKFNPERFNDKNSIIPFTYLPFGEGPRTCIGYRYGQLQVKLGVAAMISQYEFMPSEKSPKIIQFDKSTTTPSIMPKEGLFLKVTKV